MALVELKTDLKSLKNSTFGAKDLLVGKDINDPPNSKGLMMQVTRRADDLVRHTKLLGRKEGLKFLGNQALLAQTNLKQKIKQAKKENPSKLGEVLKEQAILTGINTVAGTASILAQIPVNGTGTHLIRGFGGNSYLKPLGDPSGINGLLAGMDSLSGGTGNTVNAAVNSLNGELTIIDNPAKFEHIESENFDKSKFLDSKGNITREIPYGIDSDSAVQYTSSSFVTPTPFSIPNENERYDKKDSLKKIQEVSGSRVSETVSNGDRVVRTSAKAKANYETYEIDGKAIGTINNPITLSNPGKTRLGDDGKISDEEDRPDVIQEHRVLTEALGVDKQDLIPFEFNTFTPGNVGGKFLYFRALLDGFSDNYAGDWTGTKYVGRGEELYTYNGFKRDISFDFKAAAFSKADMVPLYDKLNALVGATAPTYGNGLFMQGTFTKITVGDYLKKVPGIIRSVGLTWDKGTPWEIEGDLRVPHMLSVSIAFTPIHNFVPQEGSKYIG
jgi:hypothetical protein